MEARELVQMIVKAEADVDPVSQPIALQDENDNALTVQLIGDRADRADPVHYVSSRRVPVGKLKVSQSDVRRVSQDRLHVFATFATQRHAADGQSCELVSRARERNSC